GVAARSRRRSRGAAHRRHQLDRAGVDAGRQDGGARSASRPAAVRAPAVRRPVGAGEGGQGLMSSTMPTDERYTVISADSHAGLACEDYRPFLDARFMPQFEEFLADRFERREESLKMNYDYIMHWEGDNAEGLRGAFDIEQRDKELDADGVAAE